MNEAEETHVRKIMDAIGYGQLPPRETQQRLAALIEEETARRDQPADMRLIAAAQDLLAGLNGVSSTPGEEQAARLARLKARIAASAQEEAGRHSPGWGMAKRALAIAAVLVLVLGAFGPVNWSWMENRATSDAQQQIIRGHEITAGMVRTALAEHSENEGVYVVKKAGEFDELLGFELGVPEQLCGDWEMSFGTMQFYRKKIGVSVQYRSGTEKSRCVSCIFEFYDDAEVVYYTVEQSEEGSFVEHNGNRVYVCRNSDKISAVWQSGLTLIHVSGDVNEQEALTMIAELKGGMDE